MMHNAPFAEAGRGEWLSRSKGRLFQLSKSAPVQHPRYTALGSLTFLLLLVVLIGRNARESLPSYFPEGVVKEQARLESLRDVTPQQLAYTKTYTEDECQQLFGPLYLESDRAKAYWKSQGGITRKHVDDSQGLSSARILIFENQMYVKYFNNGLFSRAYAQLALFNEAVVSSREKLPNIEFTMSIGDWARGEPLPIWELSRENRSGTEHSWLMPDYGMYSWPEPGVGSFSEVMQKTAAREKEIGSFSKKDPRLFWKGAFWVNGLREALYNKVQGKPWADIQNMDWGNDAANNRRTIDGHCAYKYLGHIEGGSYSGRLKFIQMCRSVLVMHELKYIQHFHHLMISDDSAEQNTVVVKDDWSDIEATMEDLLANERKAKRIADNSYNTWRHYHSPAATMCYIRKMMRDYAEVQRFEPELGYDDTPYASFDLMRTTDWVIH